MSARLMPGKQRRRAAVVLAAVLCSLAVESCSSIGPGTVTRDRYDYGAAIGDSWKQQTLLNIVKLRYADFPVFLEVGQVIAGYQLQTTVGAGISAQNYISNSVGGPPAIGGSAAAAATYIDRPTIMYAPLTGTDFIKKLMAPIPPSAVLFLLQSGYSASLVLDIAIDSINGLANESRRVAMPRTADPQFAQLGRLLYELQLANALQVRIERAKDNSEAAIVTFPPAHQTPDIAAKIAEVRRILRLSGGPSYSVHYGGYSGRGDDISITTRSMLQIMLELGVLAQVPADDIAAGRAAPGASSDKPAVVSGRPLVTILSGTAPAADAYVAVQYKGHWFWIADGDFRSKSVFGAVMLLFSISDVGVRSAPPVVTVPAN
ncbi:hypothetical protein [Enhydrobacter aerosaccus]|nr:hypothetical protein [Enhydrobacter aerosaccus]